MIHYKDTDGSVYLFDTEPEPGTIRASLVLMTDEEVAAFDAIVPAEPVPTSVSRFQARGALAATVVDGVSLFTTVNTAMKALPEDNLQRLAWEDAQTFDRDSETVAAMSAQLGLTDEQLDALFIAASKIKG